VESGIYVFAALVVGAAIVFGQAAYSLVTDLDEGVDVAARNTLDGLLLTFIFVELLGAVRTTIRERRLVSEPSLLVGIIASIKEIVVIAGAGATRDQGFEPFRDAMVEIGVLGLLALVLALAAFMLRLKEREPANVEEG
jgi:uncharacterized membrane protein (DUF373 family)